QSNVKDPRSKSSTNANHAVNSERVHGANAVASRVNFSTPANNSQGKYPIDCVTSNFQDFQVEFPVIAYRPLNFYFTTEMLSYTVFAIAFLPMHEPVFGPLDSLIDYFFGNSIYLFQPIQQNIVKKYL